MGRFVLASITDIEDWYRAEDYSLNVDYTLFLDDGRFTGKKHVLRYGNTLGNGYGDGLGSGDGAGYGRGEHIKNVEISMENGAANGYCDGQGMGYGGLYHHH
jgi:hypothetical protein